MDAGPQLRPALQLIAETLGAAPVQVAPDRYALTTREPEGWTRVTLASATALLHIARRIRDHRERIANAHFWELWGNNGKFKL